MFFSHVIEHVKDRSHILGEIHRVLKPGGYLYVETPGERSLMVPKDSRLKTGSNSYPYHFLDDPTHIGEPYSRASLNASIESAGFAIERAGFYREFGSVAMPFYAFFFLCSYLPLLPAKYRSVLRGFGWWNMIGWSIYAFARKPSGVTKKAL